MRDRERKTERTEFVGSGNLYEAYGGGHPDWPGCDDEDCLPECQTERGHCERLKRFVERKSKQ